MSVEQQKLRHKLAHLFEKARKTATSSDPKSKDASASPEAKHSTLHYIADSATLAGFMASVAIAQSFSGGKANPLGIFFGILAACVFTYSFIHGLAVRKEMGGFPVYMGTGIVICLLGIYGWWLNEPTLLNIVFKNPAGLFSGKAKNSRIATISYFREFMVGRTMTHFSRYLSDAGFDIPKNVPPVGIGPSMPIWGPQSSITIDEEGIKDFREVVLAYAGSICVPMLASQTVGGPASPQTLQKVWSSEIYTAYFTCSYIGTIEGFNTLAWRHISNDPFFKSLWELRSRLTQRVVDYALSYAVKQLIVEGEGVQDFDSYFGRSIEVGILNMSADTEEEDRIVKDVFSKFGIRVVYPNVEVQTNIRVP